MEEPNINKQGWEPDISQHEQERSAYEKENKNHLYEIRQMKHAQHRFRSNKGIVVIVCMVGFIIWIIVVSSIQSDIQSSADKKLMSLRMEEYTDDSSARISRLQKQIVQQLVKGKEEDVPHILTEENAAQMDAYIGSLQRYSAEDVELQESGGVPYYLVKKQEVLGSHELMDTKNSSIFPGAIIKGDSLLKGGDYTLLSAGRTPMCLVSNQSNGEIVQVDDIDYANVALVLQGYQNSFHDENVKEWSYFLRSARSSQEAQAALGLKAGTMSSGLGASLAADSSQEQSMVAVVYSQIYYTVSAEPLKSASQYFEAGTDLSCLGAYEPAYVSSVSYGKKIIILVTDEISQSDLSAKLGAMVNGVGIEAGIKNICTDRDLTYSVYQYGGAASKVELLFSSFGKQEGFRPGAWIKEQWDHLWKGSQSLEETINESIGFSDPPINPVPVSYELKYLSDNAVVPNVFLEGQNVILTEDAKSARYEDVQEAAGDSWY